MTHEDVYLIFKTQHKNKMANYFIENNTQFKGKVTSIITDHTKKKKTLTDQTCRQQYQQLPLHRLVQNSPTTSDVSMGLYSEGSLCYKFGGLIFDVRDLWSFVCPSEIISV